MIREGVVVVVVVVSHIQRIGCQPEKLLYTVTNPDRGLLNKEKIKNEKSGSAPPPFLSPPPRALLVRRKSKSKSCEASTCLGATQVSVRLTSVQGFLRLVG